MCQPCWYIVLSTMYGSTTSNNTTIKSTNRILLSLFITIVSVSLISGALIHLQIYAKKNSHSHHSFSSDEMNPLLNSSSNAFPNETSVDSNNSASNLKDNSDQTQAKSIEDIPDNSKNITSIGIINNQSNFSVNDNPKLNSNKITKINDDVNNTNDQHISQNSISDKTDKSTSNFDQVKLSKHKSKNHDSFSNDNDSKNIEQPLASNPNPSLSNNTSDESASKFPTLSNNTLHLNTQNFLSKERLKPSFTSGEKKGNTNLNPLDQSFTDNNLNNEHKDKINNNFRSYTDTGINTKFNNYDLLSKNIVILDHLLLK